MWVPRSGVAALLALALAGAAHAQPQTPVPSQLEEWRGWALDGHEHVRCPFRYASGAKKAEDFVCAWPGRLAVEAEAARGTFTQTWTIFSAPQWVPLPGDVRTWPRTVTVAPSGRTAAPVEVVLRDGAPSVFLAPGRHRVAGAFAWPVRPAALAVPAASGIVALAVDGVAIDRPRREAGRLWLGAGEQAAESQDALDVRVYRRVEDDVPTWLRTVFAVDVSGRVREETLGPALPEGFVPLGLESALPALLDPDGDLRVQVRPGQWEIVLRARAPDVQARVVLPTERRNLPAFEIWSYQSNPRLRDTVAEGGVSADPRLEEAPWQELPAFRVQPGEHLAIVERRRGQGDAQDALYLNRMLWQDFDRSGFAFVDELSGPLRASTRLNTLAPYQLMAAEEAGEPLLVTTQDGAAGVEVRGPHLNLSAWGRIDSGGALPAGGWATKLDKMTAHLNLPPGAKLLAAFGVDDAPTSLAGRWRLLDFFLLLIVTIAAARLFGRAVGAVAFVALLLSYHEPGAVVWTWLNLLAAVALVRVAPPGRLQRVARGYRVGSIAVLVLFLVPFMIAQIRIAVYPQLETQAHRSAETWGLFEVLTGRMPEPAGIPGEIVSVTMSMKLPESAEQATDEALSLERASDPAPALPPQGLEGARQTGPGKPLWTWTQYPLWWSGPVNPAREMRLVILPPWAVSLLRFVAVLALGVLAARFAFEIVGRAWRLRLPGRHAAVAACALAMLAPIGGQAFATTPAMPSPELLRELQQRLLRPPPCAPRCAEVVDAQVMVAQGGLSIRLSLHALARVAVPLPGTADGWRPASITVGGEAAATVRDGAGVLWTLVDAGRHTVILRSPTPVDDTVEIAFPAPPRAFSVDAPQWAVAGVENGVLAAGALHLTRLRTDPDAAPAQAAPPALRVPPFVFVDREVFMAREWHVRTTVQRVAPITGPISLRVPLLEGEAIVSGAHTVEDGAVLVSMGPGAYSYAWRSTLPVRPRLTLRAPADSAWREIWRFDIGQLWRVAFEGLPASQRRDTESSRSPRFDPRPGETLVVTSGRPPALAGDTLAFDRATVRTRVGAEARTSTLHARYRSTQGASHTLTLPPDATLRRVLIDREPQPLVLEDRALAVQIVPGEHQLEVEWDEAVPAGLRTTTPNVALAAPASNLVASMEMPASRWLLFATGPPVGPAVLYWAELIALIAAALVLGRLAVAPLRTHHWLLLGLGFSTFSWFAFAVVVAWLLAHGARRRWGEALSRRVYNGTQIGFGILTLAAFAAILAGVPHGLLGTPDMSVRGFGAGDGALTWFADRTDDQMAQATVWSLPIWVYKALILAWALWLSFALLRWLPWVWACFSESGLWRPKDAGKTDPAPPKASASPRPESKSDDIWDEGPG